MSRMLALAATMTVERMPGLSGAQRAAPLRQATAQRLGLAMPESYLSPDHLSASATYYFATLPDSTVCATARIVGDKPIEDMALSSIDPTYEDRINELAVSGRLAAVSRLMLTADGAIGFAGALATYRAFLHDSLGDKTHYIFEARKRLRRRLAALGFESDVIGISRPFPAFELEPAMMDMTQCIQNLASRSRELHAFAFQDLTIDLTAGSAVTSGIARPTALNT